LPRSKLDVDGLQLPEIREPSRKAGFQPIGCTPEQFAREARIKAE
jgi:hypothetical protein